MYACMYVFVYVHVYIYIYIYIWYSPPQLSTVFVGSLEPTH